MAIFRVRQRLLARRFSADAQEDANLLPCRPICQCALVGADIMGRGAGIGRGGPRWMEAGGGNAGEIAEKRAKPEGGSVGRDCPRCLGCRERKGAGTRCERVCGASGRDLRWIGPRLSAYNACCCLPFSIFPNSNGLRLVPRLRQADTAKAHHNNSPPHNPAPTPRSALVPPAARAPPAEAASSTALADSVPTALSSHPHP